MSIFDNESINSISDDDNLVKLDHYNELAGDINKIYADTSGGASSAKLEWSGKIASTASEGDSVNVTLTGSSIDSDATPIVTVGNSTLPSSEWSFNHSTKILSITAPEGGIASGTSLAVHTNFGPESARIYKSSAFGAALTSEMSYIMGNVNAKSSDLLVVFVDSTILNKHDDLPASTRSSKHRYKIDHATNTIALIPGDNTGGLGKKGSILRVYNRELHRFGWGGTPVVHPLKNQSDVLESTVNGLINRARIMHGQLQIDSKPSNADDVEKGATVQFIDKKKIHDIISALKSNPYQSTDAVVKSESESTSRSTEWGGSENLTAVFNADFPSYGAARSFFNRGGELTFKPSIVDSSSNDSAIVKTAMDALGVRRIRGISSVPFVDSDSIGFYTMGVENQ